MDRNVACTLARRSWHAGPRFASQRFRTVQGPILWRDDTYGSRPLDARRERGCARHTHAFAPPPAPQLPRLLPLAVPSPARERRARPWPRRCASTQRAGTTVHSDRSTITALRSWCRMFVASPRIATGGLARATAPGRRARTTTLPSRGAARLGSAATTLGVTAPGAAGSRAARLSRTTP